MAAVRELVLLRPPARFVAGRSHLTPTSPPVMNPNRRYAEIGTHLNLALSLPDNLPTRNRSTIVIGSLPMLIKIAIQVRCAHLHLIYIDFY